MEKYTVGRNRKYSGTYSDFSFAVHSLCHDRNSSLDRELAVRQSIVRCGTDDVRAALFQSLLFQAYWTDLLGANDNLPYFHHDSAFQHRLLHSAVAWIRNECPEQKNGHLHAGHIPTRSVRSPWTS